MDVTVKIEGQPRIPMKLAHDGCEHVTSRDETIKCPECAGAPLMIHGKGEGARTRDSITQPAYCNYCGEVVGTIRAKFQTIFGIEEDNRVLNGRFKVY